MSSIRSLNSGVSFGMVAVGMPVTRRPPHRSPRAALPHEALILDEWRQSELGGMDGEHAAVESTDLPPNPAHLFPCLRFTGHLTVPSAKLGAERIASPFS